VKYTPAANGSPERLTIPFLLILACPLMHIFMHGGHGGHHHGGGDTEESAPRRPEMQQVVNAPQAVSGEKNNPEKKEHQHEHGGC
jgi:hypothetical protein